MAFQTIGIGFSEMNNKIYEFTVLSNTIIDISLDIDDHQVEQFGYSINNSHDVIKSTAGEFFKFINSTYHKKSPGGSPANSCFSASYIGLDCLYVGTVGSDSLADFFLNYIGDYQIDCKITKKNGKTGRCYIMFGENGGQTIVGDIGVSGQFCIDSLKNIESKIFHTSGYELMADPVNVIQAIQMMKNKGAIISYDMAIPISIYQNRKEIVDIISYVDIVFITDSELIELSQHVDYSLETLANNCSCVVYKMGKKGSIVKEMGKEYYIPSFKVDVENTIGAGDNYVAGFFSSYLEGKTMLECGLYGSYIAGEVCKKHRSHL